MKKIIINCIIISLFITVLSNQAKSMDNIKQAEALLIKAKTATVQDEAYDYINKARILYNDEYELNPTSIPALLGLSKVNQLTGDRAEAKLYVLKAYNMKPYDPKLQKAMGDFFYSFQEYSTAVEYYKLALASGLLKDFETNLQTAKCFEKLGDLENAELYYKISLHVNSKSKEVMKKINEYESAKHPDDTEKLENLKYKYLFKDKKMSPEEKTETDANKIIDSINGMF